MLVDNALNIYTDGSMLPSPRTGGVGIVFVVIDGAGDPQIVRQFDRPGYAQATNNEMELEAVIMGLREALDDPAFQPYSNIEIFTDSQYVAGNIKNLMFVWPKTQWKSKGTLRPILHVPQWKNLLKLLIKGRRDRRRINVRWVKGHRKNPYNKQADKAARRSAKNPLNPSKSIVSVRRKISAESTEIGSVKMLGQLLAVRILTTEYLGSPHRLWKYKYEVLSTDSPFHGNVDEIFSTIALRDGHHYEVRVNDNTHNPRINELIREIDRREEPLS